MLFKIKGQRFDFSPEGIRDQMNGVEPGAVRTYGVTLNGHEYPINQVLSIATGLPPAAIATNQAYGVLTKLGLEVHVAQGTGAGR